MRTPLEYLELDVWLAVRTDGRGYRAYTNEYPWIGVEADGLPLLARRCAAEFRLHSLTDGFDARYVVAPSFRPAAMPEPRESRPGSRGGCRVVGRMLVVAVSGDVEVTLGNATDGVPGFA